MHAAIVPCSFTGGVIPENIKNKGKGDHSDARINLSQRNKRNKELTIDPCTNGHTAACLYLCIWCYAPSNFLLSLSLFMKWAHASDQRLRDLAAVHFLSSHAFQDRLSQRKIKCRSWCMRTKKMVTHSFLFFLWPGWYGRFALAGQEKTMNA